MPVQRPPTAGPAWGAQRRGSGLARPSVHTKTAPCPAGVAPGLSVHLGARVSGYIHGWGEDRGPRGRGGGVGGIRAAPHTAPRGPGLGGGARLWGAVGRSPRVSGQEAGVGAQPGAGRDAEEGTGAPGGGRAGPGRPRLSCSREGGGPRRGPRPPKSRGTAAWRELQVRSQEAQQPVKINKGGGAGCRRPGRGEGTPRIGAELSGRASCLPLVSVVT